MASSVLEDAPGGNRTDVRDSEEGIAGGGVDVYREGFDVFEGNGGLGIELPGEETVGIEGGRDFAFGEAVDAVEPAHLVEVVASFGGRSGVLLKGGVAYGMEGGVVGAPEVLFVVELVDSVKKVYVGVDEGTGLVRKTVLTPARVYESAVADKLINGDEGAVYGDRAYESRERRKRLKDLGINDRIMHRSHKHQKGLPHWQKRRNELISPIRKKISVSQSRQKAQVLMGGGPTIEHRSKTLTIL